MSWQPTDDPRCDEEGQGTVALVITPKEHDIGGLIVRRTLPNRNRRAVGPFVFFDQMGPATFAPGQGIDVRPHPHIGLATITYLFDGAIMHRDSLGIAEVIRPGEVNWMTAGSGVVHSERTPDEERAAGHVLSGIQAWIALPIDAEETTPGFSHHAAEDLPAWDGDGYRIRLIAGRLDGKEAPVKTFSPMFYADARLDAGASVTLAPEHEERAIHVAEGAIEIAGERFEVGQTVILTAGSDVTVTATDGSRVMLLGGAPLDTAPDARPNQPRHMFWNFVSHSRDRIELAKDDWKNGRFPAVPGETEFIPLPE